MSSEDEKERERAVAAVAEHGWYPGRLTGKGYMQMFCGCGQHTMVLPKTPRLSSTFRNKARRMIAVCSTNAQE